MGHTLKIKINPGKLDQVAATFSDSKRFKRIVTAVDEENAKAFLNELYELHGIAAARFLIAILENGFASCDEVAELLKVPHYRAG